jgi:hypothetical protein
MILWRKGGNYNVARYSCFVSPGVLFPDSSDFFDECGKAIQFQIDFKFGKADNVPSNLGRYLIDQGLAQETRFILE